MNSIRRIFTDSKNIIHLGRWSLKYDEHTLQRIVHLANEDHCGCCEVKMSKDDEYYAPFVYNLLG